MRGSTIDSEGLAYFNGVEGSGLDSSCGSPAADEEQQVYGGLHTALENVQGYCRSSDARHTLVFPQTTSGATTAASTCLVARIF